MWSDNETELDFLNFTGVADTVAEIIVQAQGNPISIGVSGARGVGKSSMIRLIRRSLDRRENADFIFVEFNAWLYQGYDDARAALMEVIAGTLTEEAEKRKKGTEKAKEFLERIRWFRLAKLVTGPAVIKMDQAISQKSSELVGQLNGETDGELEIHQHDFWLFIKALANGLRGGVAASLALALLENEHGRLQLFEDVPSGGAKVTRSVELARRGRPAVVYCREIQLVNQLAGQTWPTAPAIAHSGLGDRYLQETLRFKSGARDVLLMTRDLGKRGLDFPMARSLVLYSPKSSVRTMDQELCRTRGQRRDRGDKPVYVLFYAGTYEEEKMRRVLGELIEISMYEKFRKFTLSRRWHKWLRERSPLTMPEYLSTAAKHRSTGARSILLSTAGGAKNGKRPAAAR